jgi:hypothetical protein
MCTANSRSSSYNPSIPLSPFPPHTKRNSIYRKWNYANGPPTTNLYLCARHQAYTYRDVDANPALRPIERQRIAQVNEKFQQVFMVTKGNLPPPADHPSVYLNFRPEWKHVYVATPKWGRGAAQVLEQWAREQLRSGLFERSKSPSASRLHIVRKPPHDAPKDVDITQCDLRI